MNNVMGVSVPDTISDVFFWFSCLYAFAYDFMVFTQAVYPTLRTTSTDKQVKKLINLPAY